MANHSSMTSDALVMVPAGIRRLSALGTRWYFKVAKACATKPKHLAVARGEQQGHQLFFERRVKNTRGDRDHRQFGSFRDLTHLSTSIATENHNLFEILRPGRPVKLYLDFDQHPGAPGDIGDCIRMLQAGHADYFGLQLEEKDVFLSCATGVAEEGRWAGQRKVSYHLVVDNGMAFPDVQACKRFLSTVFPGGFLDTQGSSKEEAPVDMAPYQSYQSFKAIHQSKAVGSDRVQKPQTGGWANHLVTHFSRPPTQYDMSRLSSAVQEKTKHGGTNCHKQQCLPVHVNRAAEPMPWVDPAAVNPHSVPSLLQYLPNHIEQPWELFFTVACVCKNEGVSFEDFDTWCRQSSKYNSSATESTWNGLERRMVSLPGQPARTIATLRRLVQHAHPGIFEAALEKWVHQCIFPTVNFQELGIKRRTYSHRFVKPFTQPWTLYPHLLLRSHMGTGKTTQAVEAIRNMAPKSLLIVTPRQTLAASSMGVYKKVVPELVLYKSSTHLEQERFVVCQLESLWKVGSGFDMVILDESESILAQFSSETLKHFDAVQQKFKEVVQCAQHCLWLDAFLADRTITTCLALAGDPNKMRYTENTFQPVVREACMVGRGGDAKMGIKAILKDLVQQGDKTVFVSGSRALLEEVEADILPQPRLCITAKTSESTKSRLRDANELFKEYHHVAYTASITVGVNFDIRDHFDSLVMYFSACSATVRDMVQSSMRVRHLAKDRLFYAIYPRYHGNQHFDVFTRQKLRDIIEGRVQFETELEMAKDPLWIKRKELDPWLRELWVFNTQERNVSAFHQERLVEQFLRLCGYVPKQGTLTSHEARLLVQGASSTAEVAYDEVPAVSHHEWHELLQQEKRGVASEEDKLVIAKHYLCNYMMRPGMEPSGEVMHNLFNAFVQDQPTIMKKAHNIQSEHGIDVGESNVFHDNRAAKVHHLRQICVALGVRYTQQVEAAIDRVALQKTCEDILEKKEALQTAFGLRYQEVEGKPGSSCNAIKRGLEILNAMLASWGFTTIRMAKKRKRCRRGGRQQEFSTFEVVPQGGEGKRVHATNTLLLRFLDIHPERCSSDPTAVL